MKPKMRPILGCITCHLDVGVSTKKEKEAIIKNLAQSWGPRSYRILRTQNLIGACSLYTTGTSGGCQIGFWLRPGFHGNQLAAQVSET